MPTYQYACTNPECGNRFELVQSFTDPSASECPVCGQAVRKVYGSVGVVFKGSGFYRTDSRAGNSAAVSSTPSDSSSSSSETKSGSSDSKSATSESKSGSSESKASPASSTSTSAAAS